MPNYVFLGPRPLENPPPGLNIPRGDPFAIVRAAIIQLLIMLWWPFYLALEIAIHGSSWPSWWTSTVLLGWVYFGVMLVRHARALIANLKSDAPYVTIDKSGLVCSLPTRQSRPWSDIVACAARNENGRRVLRLFLSGRAGITVDIDFALAAQPKHSLDEAMVACAAWIAATRDPSETASPIREFVEKRWAGATGLRRSSDRAGLYVFAIVLGVVAVVAIGALSRPVREEPPMPVDGRPEQRVLFLGNSRIAVNDLPRMVRDVADSAKAPIRYDIHMRAWGGATFKEHWNNSGDHAVLRQPWTLVILQPQSEAFMGAWASHNTASYGEKLIRAAEAGGSNVAVMANWPLGSSFFSGDPPEAAAAAKSYAETIARDTQALAGRAGAGVIDLDGAFAEAAETMPEVELTEDGNHPSHAGTYLAALVIYGYLSHADLTDVTWRPYDMSKPTAVTLKEIAARHMR